MRLRIVLVGALSLALSGISILCCYVFGTHLAPGIEGQLYGALGGIADALKAFLPLAIAAALAARQKGRAAAGAAMFAVFSLYSFTSELGLYALGRNAVASDAQAGREAYEAAKADRGGIASRLKELGPQRPTGAVQADMDAAKQGGLWRGSEGCTQATWPAARTFCTGFEKLKGELASAQEAERLRGQDEKLAVKLSGFDLAAVMRSSDPQSEALSRFTGFSSSAIRDALAVLVALLIELGSGLGLWVATAGTRAARPTSKAPCETGPVAVAVPAREPQKTAEPPSVVEALSPTEMPKAFPAPARPRLVTSRADPVGSVAVIMADILEPGRGKVEIADVFAAYAEACEASGKRPIPANEFPAAIAELCQRLGIEIEDNEKGVFLLKVRLKKGNENEETFHPEVSNHDGA
jgi:hypothetical protein